MSVYITAICNIYTHVKKYTRTASIGKMPSCNHVLLINRTGDNQQCEHLYKAEVWAVFWSDAFRFVLT